mmetsp:Transcript_32371/g.102768  ORF Transcript_32371/g.102768 Transcript_32371/m.102768 type:complete len:243 (-) Transcript_32371:50-778(-)
MGRRRPSPSSSSSSSSSSSPPARSPSKKKKSADRKKAKAAKDRRPAKAKRSRSRRGKRRSGEQRAERQTGEHRGRGKQQDRSRRRRRRDGEHDEGQELKAELPPHIGAHGPGIGGPDCAMAPYPGYGGPPYGGGWPPVPFGGPAFHGRPEPFGGGGGGGSHDRSGNYRAFGGRDDRERPQWVPGQGRNPDLEAERLTGAGLARPYSEHDDRRAAAGSSPSRRRGASPGGPWRHDLFEELTKK